MNNKVILLLVGFISTLLPVAVSCKDPNAGTTSTVSLAQYRQKQQELTALRDASAAKEARTSYTDKASSYIAEKTQELPALTSKLTKADTDDLSLLQRAIAQRLKNELGPDDMAADFKIKHALGMFRSTLVKDNANLRAALLIVRRHKSNLPKLLENPEWMEALFFNPRSLLNSRATSQTANTLGVLQKTLSTLETIKKYLSPSQWTGVRLNFVGSFFQKFWHFIWQQVAAAVVTVVGEEKIYSLNPDGSVKLDAQGRKMPHYVTKSTIENDRIVRKKVPSEWYKALADEESLLGQFVMAGVERSLSSTLKAFDRLVLHPIASGVLQIPLWKMSFLQYTLAVAERSGGNVPVVTAKKLTDSVIDNKDDMLVMGAGFPFSMQRILAEFDKQKRAERVNTAITQHMWGAYAPVWEEIANNVTIYKKIAPSLIPEPVKLDKGEEEKTKLELTIPEITPGRTTPQTSLTKAKEWGDKLVDEGIKIAKEAVKGMINDGPLQQHVMFASLALTIPQTLYSLQGMDESKGNLVKKDGTDFTADEHAAALRAMDICEAIAREARRSNGENAKYFKNAGETLHRVIRIRHAEGEDAVVYGIDISPATQQKLLERQESFLKPYMPFMSTAITPPHLSYSDYMVKLTLPRLMFKVLPTEVKKRLKIENLADTAANIRTIQKHFRVFYRVTSTLSYVMSTVKRFENVESFAGNYVEVTDALNQFIDVVGELIHEVKPNTRAPWEKHIAELARMTGKKLRMTRAAGAEYSFLGNPFKIFQEPAAAFSVRQNHLLSMAAQKSTYVDPILHCSRQEAIAYLNDGLRHKLFDTSAEKLQAVVADQKDNKTHLDSEGKAPITVIELNGIVDNWYLSGHGQDDADDDNDVATGITGDPKTKARLDEVTQRALDLELHTFALLALNRNTTEDKFFTNGEDRSNLLSQARVTKDVEAFKETLNNRWRRIFGHCAQGIHVLQRLYKEFGLREIVLALDEHYRATGEKLTQVPTKMLARIAVREGMAGAIGWGADWVFKKGIGKLMNVLAQVQERGVFGGHALNQIAEQRLAPLLSGRGGKSVAYSAAQSIIRNVFDYGSTALKVENVGKAAMNSFNPMQQNAAYDELELHHTLSQQSGRAPNPVMAEKLKRANFAQHKRTPSGRDMSDYEGYDNYDAPEETEEDDASDE